MKLNMQIVNLILLSSDVIFIKRRNCSNVEILPYYSKTRMRNSVDLMKVYPNMMISDFLDTLLAQLKRRYPKNRKTIILKLEYHESWILNIFNSNKIENHLTDLSKSCATKV